ncbi:hypothetical protein [Saccharolobus caldissimus]|uniref:Uncharacterized protein n=1 Tax=Saccharolobus caldissimus TaxID=1702097 RepID=A0AAQ4CMF3_9CREN|nr:hypothetical protein SACC_00010 [Saccharolobus caldissimus]
MTEDIIIGIGQGPLADFVKKHGISDKLYPYPAFFDDKIVLLRSKAGYIPYLKKMIFRINEIKIALWPDYIKPETAAKIVDLNLLRNVLFVVPIHDIKDVEIGEELEAKGFRVFYGFASDKKYRDYSLEEFLGEIKGDKWYLGVSSKRELKEALVNNFSGFDVTGYLFGKHKDRKNPQKLQKMLLELLATINKHQGRQTTLYDFINSPVKAR